MTFGDYVPVPVTEWADPDGHTDDCGWRSALVAANKASLGAYPPTQAESEKLGQGASTVEANNAGILAQYGWHGTVYRGALAGYLAALVPGVGGIIDGYYAALPIHYQRFDPHFATTGRLSYHAAYAQRMPDGTFWWIDPLFHNEPGYRGEPISLTALSAFAAAYGSAVAALLVTEGSHVPGDNMVATVTLTPFSGPRAFRVPAGTRVDGWDPASPTPVHSNVFAVTWSAHADGQASIVQSPNAAVRPHGFPFVRIVDGTYKGLYIVEGIGKLDPEPPPPAPDCSVQVKAATDPLNAKITTLNAQLATATSDARKATKTEAVAASTAAIEAIPDAP